MARLHPELLTWLNRDIFESFFGMVVGFSHCSPAILGSWINIYGK
jgi:hypothetical protein